MTLDTSSLLDVWTFFIVSFHIFLISQMCAAAKNTPVVVSFAPKATLFVSELCEAHEGTADGNDAAEG
jgi:hypothetical protein